MKPLLQFICKKPQKKYSTIKKQSSLLELDAGYPNTEAHIRIHFTSKMFKNNDKISYTSTTIELHNILINNIGLDECFASYYENDIYYLIPLIDKIIDDISKNKAIFLNVILCGYGYNPTAGENFYKHAISIIFQPYKGHYKGFIINSHGHDTNHEVEEILSSTRIKTTIYKEGVDVALMKKIVEYINTFTCKQIVEYKGDSSDTYLGANLQSSDWRGFCYMYPFVIFYYYGFYYSEKRHLGDILEIESSHKLLKNGNMTQFVHGIFAEFNERFKEKIIEIKNSNDEKYLDSLDEIIISQDYRFIKDIISPYLSFLKQKCF